MVKPDNRPNELKMIYMGAYTTVHQTFLKRRIVGNEEELESICLKGIEYYERNLRVFSKKTLIEVVPVCM